MLCFRSRIKDYKDLVADISSGLANLESNRSEWEKQKTFWRNWSVFLGADSNKTLMEAFGDAHETIEKALEDLTGAITDILAMQDRASKLLDENIRLSQIVSTAFSNQRSNIFKKTEKSFFSPAFYSLFDSFFWRSIWNNFGNFDDVFDSRSLWLILVRIFMVVLVYFLATSLRGMSKVRQDRLYLLNHPLALGIFLAETLPIIFINQPTGLARDLSWTLVAFSSSILVSGSLNIPHQVVCLMFYGRACDRPRAIENGPPAQSPFPDILGVYDPGRNSSLLDMGKTTAQESTAEKGVFSRIYAGQHICHGHGNGFADSRFCQPL